MRILYLEKTIATSYYKASLDKVFGDHYVFLYILFKSQTANLIKYYGVQVNWTWTGRGHRKHLFLVHIPWGRNDGLAMKHQQGSGHILEFGTQPEA